MEKGMEIEKEEEKEMRSSPTAVVARGIYINEYEFTALAGSGFIDGWTVATAAKNNVKVLEMGLRLHKVCRPTD